ncbi:hypothetical protein FRC02_011942 [Tulasnella sp. 418]|nr:hypothetical protein FRC02_011942 [Tulasnella sp. 418]
MNKMEKIAKFSSLLEQQYYGYAVQDADKALQIFYDACAAAGPDLCAIATSNSTGATVGQWVNDLIDTAYTGNVFGAANLLRAQLVQAARSPTAWPAFASQLAAAYRDLHPAAATNTSTTRRLRLRYFEPFALSKRQESDYPWATSLSSLYAIWCGDTADDTGIVDTTTVFNDLIRVTKEVTNVEGPFGVVYPSAFCQFWKTRAVERHFPQGPPMLANPVIIIGNTYDSLTPLASARKLVTRLNGVGTRQAALIQQDGSGHLSLQMNSVCTYSIIQRYFTDGVFPEDTLCGTNFNGFARDPTTGNNSTSTSIISAPLASISLGLQANEALARAPLTIFQIFILSIIGIFSGLLITL